MNSLLIVNFSVVLGRAVQSNQQNNIEIDIRKPVHLGFQVLHTPSRIAFPHTCVSTHVYTTVYPIPAVQPSASILTAICVHASSLQTCKYPLHQLGR